MTMDKVDIVLVNALVLLLIFLTFIVTVISTSAGLGVVVGSMIVTTWNILRGV